MCTFAHVKQEIKNKIPIISTSVEGAFFLENHKTKVLMFRLTEHIFVRTKLLKL